MRSLTVLVLVALLAAPVAGQGLERPEGWQVRFDMPGASEADLEMFVEMPPGWHVTSGPAGIYWSPEVAIVGNFRAEMEVFLFDPQGRREAFGIFLGGRDLEGAGQQYTYFLLRDGGQFCIKRRAGTDATTIQGWTSHNAIRRYADRGEEASVRNVLAVEAGAETVRFFVNDAEVADVARSDVELDGIFGFRVNQALSLHISRLEASPRR